MEGPILHVRARFVNSGGSSLPAAGPLPRMAATHPFRP